MGSTEIDLPQILSHPLLVEKYIHSNGGNHSPRGTAISWPGPDLRPYLDFQANLTRLFHDTTKEEIELQRQHRRNSTITTTMTTTQEDDDLDPWQGIGDRKAILSALSLSSSSSDSNDAAAAAMSMGSFFQPTSRRTHPSGSLGGSEDSSSSSLSFFSSSDSSSSILNAEDTAGKKAPAPPPSLPLPRSPLELARHSNLSSNAPEFVPTRAFPPPPSDHLPKQNASMNQRLPVGGGGHPQQQQPSRSRSGIYRTWAQSSGDGGFYVRSFHKEKSQPHAQSGFQSMPQPPPPTVVGKFSGSGSSRGPLPPPPPLTPRLTAMRPQISGEKDHQGRLPLSSSRQHSHSNKMSSRFYRGVDRSPSDFNGERIFHSSGSVSYISSRKLQEKKGSCSFCRQKGESREIYDSHCLRNPISNEVMCPNFGDYACKFCDRQSCDLLHTTDKCPILLGYKSKKMGKIPTPLLSIS